MKTVLRFIASGDFQAHNWSQFSYIRKDGVNSRLHNILKVFGFIRKEAKEREIDKVLLNGDIFEESDYHPTDVYNSVYMQIERMHDDGLDVVINLGNHDIFKSANGNRIHTLTPFRKVATIVEKPQLVWEHLYAVPYLPAEQVKEAVKEIAIGRPLALVCHAGVQGATVGPKRYLVRNQLKLADMHPEKFDIVLLSDYHTAQRLADNVLYLGSPLQHTFGETHKPCIWDVSLWAHSPGYRLEKIYTHFPMFVRAQIYDQEDLQDVTKTAKGNYLHLDVFSKEITDEDIKKFAEENNVHVRVQRKADSESPSSKTGSWAASPLQLIDKFVRTKVGGEKQRESLTSLGRDLYEGKESD